MTGNTNNTREDDLLDKTSKIVAAYFNNHSVAPEQIPHIIHMVNSSLKEIASANSPPKISPKSPAVPIDESVTDDYIICLEDGRHLKMLKRYLRTAFKMTPHQYRTRWGLPDDYPMVAPNYAKRRSDFAKKIGLGQKRD